MMVILPAIDIKNGTCVRLYQGDFSTAQQVAADPVSTARAFQKAGARWIHLVDLDGAKNGLPVNDQIVANVVASTKLRVEVGGGIRNMKTVQAYLQCGVSRVILGSAAVKSPDLVRQAVKEYGERIAVGIDAKEEWFAAEGWLETSRVHFIDLAREMEQVGVKTIIYTDISRDGTLHGPNLDHYYRLLEAVSCQIIASGGIRDLRDIRELKASGLHGAICGKSIYQGTLDLGQALQEALRKEE